MNLRRVLISSAMLVVFIFSAVAVPRAVAGWAQCRSDPVVILTNGMILDLSADIGTFPWNVQHVDYVLHVPQGVGLVASIATPAWPTSRETFTLYADGQPGEYHVETVAYTNLGNAAVTARTLLVSALGLHLDNAAVPGYEGQVLHTYLTVP